MNNLGVFGLPRTPKFALLFFTAFLFLAIFPYLSTSLILSVPGTACTLAEFDQCTIAFTLTKAESLQTEPILIEAKEWIKGILSISSQYNLCGLSDDRSYIVLYPEMINNRSRFIECLVIKHEYRGVTFTKSNNYDLLFPPIIYNPNPITLIPLSSICSNFESNQNCQAQLTFSPLALPFTIETTSELNLSTLVCHDTSDSGYNIPIETVLNIKWSLGNSITHRNDRYNGVFINTNYDLNLYEVSVTDLSLLDVNSITCVGDYSKPIISPHFEIWTKERLELFESFLIAYKPIKIDLYQDCTDSHSNSCTLVYIMNNGIPYIDDLHVEAKGFAGYLNSPQICPERIIPKSDPNFPPTNLYICQRWRKNLQSYDSNTGLLSRAVSSNVVVFSGRYFPDFPVTFDETSILYHNPLIFDWDTSICDDDTSLECPLIISTNFNGPLTEMRFTIPYSGIVLSANCNSNWLYYSYNLLTLTLGNKNEKYQQIPHPDGQNWENSNQFYTCTLFIAKVPFESTVLTPGDDIEHVINYYRDIPSNTFYSNLHTDAKYESHQLLQPYITFPFNAQNGDNCLDPESDICDLNFKIEKNTLHLLRTFTITLPALIEDFTPEDYELIILNPNENDGTIALDVIVDQWRHPNSEIEYNNQSNPNQPPTNILTPNMAVNVHKYCNKATKRWCKPAPGEINTDCDPSCDFTNPDDYKNPCTRCTSSYPFFKIVINGSVKSDFVIRYRKQVWKRTFQNSFFIYDYSGVKFTDGYRIGNGDIDNISKNTIVVVFWPKTAVSFKNCENKDRSVCTVIASRRDMTIPYFHFIMDTDTLIIGKNLQISTQVVKNQLSGELITVGYAPIPDYTIEILDFPVPLPKRVGVNGRFNVRSLYVEEITGPDESEWVYNPNDGNDFNTPLVYHLDGYPTWGLDCKEISTETCTGTYIFSSFISTSNLVEVIGSGPVTMIKHYISPSTHLHSIDFDPTVVSQSAYLGTKVEPSSGLRDMVTLYPITLPVTCFGDKMDVDTVVEILYEPGEAGQNGIITLTLVQGEFPMGATCKVRYWKMATLNHSKRVRDLPMVLLNQNKNEFYKNGIFLEHFLTFPRLEFSKLIVQPFENCYEQPRLDATITYCTLQLHLYGSTTQPLIKFTGIIPPFVRFVHPFFPVGTFPIFSKVISQNNFVKNIFSGDLGQQSNSDDNNNNSNSNNIQIGSIQIAYMDPQPPGNGLPPGTPFPPFTGYIDPLHDHTKWRFVNLSILPAFRQQNSIGYVNLSGKTHQSVIKAPLPQFFLQLTYNGDESLTREVPFVQFPYTLTEIVFTSGANMTFTNSGEVNARIEFRFEHDGVQMVDIEQDLTFSNKMIPIGTKIKIENLAKNDNFNILETKKSPKLKKSTKLPKFVQEGVQNGTELTSYEGDGGFDPTYIPCYEVMDHTGESNDNSENENFENSEHFIPLEKYVKYYQDNADNNKEMHHKIIAWVKTNPQTGRSVLTPIDMTIMKGKACYLYYRVTKSTKSHNIKHTITALTQPLGLIRPTPEPVQVVYYGEYPSYNQSAGLIELK